MFSQIFILANVKYHITNSFPASVLIPDSNIEPYFLTAKSFTNLARLTGNFNIKNGLAQTNDLQAVIDGGTLGATGAVNAAREGQETR